MGILGRGRFRNMTPRFMPEREENGKPPVACKSLSEHGVGEFLEPDAKIAWGTRGPGD